MTKALQLKRLIACVFRCQNSKKRRGATEILYLQRHDSLLLLSTVYRIFFLEIAPCNDLTGHESVIHIRNRSVSQSAG